MKKIFYLAAALVLLTGCVAKGPEHYEELSEKERAALLHTARALALRSNAVPAHLQSAFVKLAPYERIVYDGNKHGKASFRWEIYEKRRTGRRLTQKDVNPYWVMVYATGDLQDPAWKLSHANQSDLNESAPNRPQRLAPGRSRPVRQVRYNN